MSSPMDQLNEMNRNVVQDFRANAGKVGGQFEGAPMVLVHHRGRKSGRDYISPMVYLAHESDDDVIFVFASKGGGPSNPDWYYNLVAAGKATVERGSETYVVKVDELRGEARDRVYDEQARRMPGFAEYAKQTQGIRTIPVLELTRDVAATDG